MAFTVTPEKYVGKIQEVTLGATAAQGGTRSHTVTIGGSNAPPGHCFEGRHPHRPVVALEVFDQAPNKYPDTLRKYYGEVLDRPGDMAKMCVEKYGAEMISVRLEGTHPEKGNRTVDQAVAVVQAVQKAVSVPLIITGHGHYEKNNEVMKKVSEALQGENCLIHRVEKDNYKVIAAACQAYHHSLAAQSPIDVNLAKQLNILLTDLDFSTEKLVIDPLTGALGYGLEYSYSIMERIRNDGLAGDRMLAFPLLVTPGYECAMVKEARVSREAYPAWGDTGSRHAYWETVTALSLLMAGADLLVMYHPLAAAAIKKSIDKLMGNK